MEELAQEYLEDLMDFLTEGAQGLIASETMDEVCQLVDAYRKDYSAEESSDFIESETRLNLSLVEADDDNVSRAPTVAVDNFNRGFLLDKATTAYYKKYKLDTDVFDDLSPADKIKHRKGVTSMYNELILKESEKPAKDSIYTNPTFKAIVNRKSDSDVFEEDEVERKAANKYFRGQIKNKRARLREVLAGIEAAEKQNKIESISGGILNMNLNRIEELEEEKEELESEINAYKEKMS